MSINPVTWPKVLRLNNFLDGKIPANGLPVDQGDRLVSNLQALKIKSCLRGKIDSPTHPNRPENAGFAVFVIIVGGHPQQ